jgi:hypothetical protein
MTKKPKMCGKKELHQLFIRLATMIEEHEDNDGDDFIDMEIEPIIERFIADYYCDVEPAHIVIYLLVWFAQWRVSRGQWATMRDHKKILQLGVNYGMGVPPAA